MPWSVGGVSRAGRVCFSADLVNESNRCYWVPDPAGSRVGPGLRLVSCRRAVSSYDPREAPWSVDRPTIAAAKTDPWCRG